MQMDGGNWQLPLYDKWKILQLSGSQTRPRVFLGDTHRVGAGGGPDSAAVIAVLQEPKDIPSYLGILQSPGGLQPSLWLSAQLQWALFCCWTSLLVCDWAIQKWAQIADWSSLQPHRGLQRGLQASGSLQEAAGHPQVHGDVPGSCGTTITMVPLGLDSWATSLQGEWPFPVPLVDCNPPVLEPLFYKGSAALNPSACLLGLFQMPASTMHPSFKWAMIMRAIQTCGAKEQSFVQLFHSWHFLKPQKYNQAFKDSTVL